MKTRAAVLLICAMLGSRIIADDMAVKNQLSKSFSGHVSRDFSIQYLLFLPKGYEASADKRWPLMLFLHGAGERGTNLAKVTVHGPPKLVKQRDDFPFILASPQCPAGQTWSDEALLGLLDEIQKEYRVDPSRVYLTGLSMGGYGTWSLGLKHPTRFAAIVPICGGGSLLDVLLPKRENEARLKKLPVWAFHGGKDPIVPLDESERMVNALKKNGNPNVKLTVFPDAGHDSWTQAYDMPELFDWLLEQRRTGGSKKSGSTSGER